MTFRAESSTLQKRHLAFHTSTVNISPCLYVVKGIGNYSLVLEELVAEDLFGVLAYFIQSGFDVAFESRIHLADCSRSSGTFWLSEMFLPE